MIAADDRERGGGVMTAPAAILVLALVLCVGLGVDGVRKAQLLAAVTASAEEAARAGGQELDTVALRRGLVELDEDRARAAALNHLAESGVTGAITIVDGGVRVRATGTRPAVFLGLIGIGELTAEGFGEARPVVIPSGDEG
ncbi:hypothetical protein [Pseudonocardia oroxyli]|uniref:Flp pilus-assembly TadE/G-like n=1 Tax=Pseudonocardia oroxyli TaxID=366584 RepID=A0A1G8CII2_PSEOR|nr:hypothetical protein [Pseudonocardia oroxyli]SDH44710.1 hypothetical protein SAMN05216377_12294 [Pseudonocardia oroxyli]